VIIAAPMIAFTQSSELPAFEEASVKPNNFTGTRALRIEPGRLVATRMSLRNLIEEAYGVAGFQILGGPTWRNSDVYDIEAKAEHTTSKAQLLVMLQSLLADRSNSSFIGKVKKFRSIHLWWESPGQSSRKCHMTRRRWAKG
jgi:uncharacterized protein (TIGR03435 family)